MTDIEKKALALVNEVQAEYPLLGAEVSAKMALCRAIEQHEAFRQEVSDAIVQYCGGPKYVPSEPLARFIIAKPDPLIEVLNTLMMPDYQQREFREALAKRGGKIVWGDEQ